MRLGWDKQSFSPLRQTIVIHICQGLRKLMTISKGSSKKEKIGQTIFDFQKGLRNEF